MKCYFDGSEGLDNLNHDCLTLAGYAATDPVWANFDDKWTAMLRDRYPIAPYIPMNELMGWDDPFERVMGWDEGKKKKLISDAIEVLKEFGRFKPFCMFICTVDLKAYRHLLAVGHLISDPHVICAEMCVGNAIAWCYDKMPAQRERAHVF